MDINKILYLVESRLDESITFSVDTGARGPKIDDALSFIFSGVADAVAREIGMDNYRRLFRLEPDGFDDEDIVNLYLNYDAKESDRGLIEKGLKVIREFAKKHGVKLGEFKAEVNEAKMNDPNWSGPEYWNESDSVSKIRVIRIPILKYPEGDHSDAPEMNLSNENAGMVFNLLGMEYDYAGEIPANKVSDYLRRLLKAKNKPNEIERHTKPTTSSQEDRGMKVSRDSDNVTNISRNRGPMMHNIGRNNSYVTRAIDELIKIFKYAAENNFAVSWG